MKDAGPPRFVPILTEVVQGADSQDASSEAAAAAREKQLAERVRARVLAELEPMVLDALRTAQAQQFSALEARVRADLAARVARLVDEAMAPPAQD
ncbi:MAG: hypothetical protein RL522_2955 [Pseudomonadota bacterium]|jgi:hypothetical protein